MASTLTQQLFATVYKDDFRDSANFHRILFNSGRALQAREVTQLQTIIQAEMGRFGRNLFKEGAAVNPGGPTINAAYEFIKLNTSVNALPANPQSLVGTVFVGGSSNLRAQVLEVVAAEGSDPATLYVQYLGDASAGGSTALRMTPGETISNGSTTLTVQTTNTVPNPAVGQGVRFSVGAGDFFVQGHFVYNQAQSIILSKYDNQYTGVVGFRVTEDVVTAADDINLYDNQGAVPNTTAPGADRYRIRLTLVDQGDLDSADSFVFYANIINSEIVQAVSGSDDYNKINDLLALRTREESGDYVVRPFTLKFDEDSATATYLLADISPGTAYVNGYRAATIAPTTIQVEKPDTTQTVNNQVVAANFGNYVVVDDVIGVPNINEFERWVLFDSTARAVGDSIGTARIRLVEEDGGDYNFYLFDIQMNTNKSFRSVKSIGGATSLSSNYAHLVLENGQAVLKNPSNNDLLFALPNNRPSTLTDISLQVQRRFSVATDGSGNATLGSGLLGAGEVWSNTQQWVIVNNTTGANVSGVSIVSGSGTTTANITGTGVLSGTLEVLAYVTISNATARAKTLTETTIAGTVESDGTGVRFVDLRQADIYDVSRIRLNDSNGEDLEAQFRLDNGQRDNFYDIGRLVLKFGRSAPAGNVFVRYRYFQHGAGNFFSVNSYAIDYRDIPSHTLADGTIVPLRDVLDFRSRIDSSGSSYSGGTAKVNALPIPTDLIQFDATYYLPRFDKLVISQEGVLSIIQGEPSFDPKFPITPENSLELYRIRMNANTLNDSDIAITVIDNKRYTMADIGKLEKRIDRLEEFTTLSLLEVDTNTIAVLDSAGLARTKAGFLADNFADHFFSDTVAADYRASVDPSTKTLRPSVDARNIRLIYDSAQSSNTIIKGDNIYLKYTEAVTIAQDYISSSENVNPFAVVQNTGFIDMSPSSDEWMITRYIAPRVIDGGVRLDTSQARLFNQWQWNWQGLVANNSNLVGRQLATQTTTQIVGNTTTRTTTVDRVVSDETIREVVGDRVVDIALIPFMRSRRVYFRVVGLLPYQRFWPFFDGVDVSDWVKQETFVHFSQNTEDYGDRYQSATSHPWGSTALVSDVNGVIEGSFFIPSGAPNSATPRFRTGVREFRLLNVSTNDLVESTSRAFGTYTARGLLETRQRTILSTRQIVVRSTQRITSTTRESTTRQDRGQADPLAQSFFVAEREGIFLTKARVYFKSKPGGGANPAPVVLEIRPLVNGQPSSTEVVPGSIVTLLPSDVNLPVSETKANILAAGTDFVFPEPIYLQGLTEYALVLLSDTTDYRVYVAQAGAFEIGTTERRIGTQPSLGTLFKSQTGTTWTPDQTRDMTFRLYKAQFDTDGGFAILENAAVPFVALPPDPLILDSGSRWVTIYHPNHGFDSGDTVKIFGLDSAVEYGGVLGSSIMETNTVSFPDQTGYQIYIDSAATSSVFAGGDGVIAQHNLVFSIVNPSIDTLVVDQTSIGVEGKFTSGRSLAGGETRFSKDPAYAPLVLRENNISTVVLMVANEDAETVQMGGTKSATIKVSMSTASANISPVIDMQRASLILANNVIDRQDSDRTLTSPAARAGGSGFNTPLVFVAETDPEDGSHAAKHITTPVTLAEDAVGLRIILGANRPSVSDFLVYYRTAGSGENIRTKEWSLVTVDAPVPSDENPTVFREYRYLAGGLNGTLTPFTQYQVKIVFRSTNAAKVPVIKDLRVIALAD